MNKKIVVKGKNKSKPADKPCLPVYSG